jgi:RNA polymerase sigma-70 factor (ECF subfamily)
MTAGARTWSGYRLSREASIDQRTDAEREHRFSVLYSANYHRILGYARRRCAADDAFDVVAETFTIAWRRLDDVPGGERALYWLYATARRVLANHRRGQRRRANLIHALEANASPAASSDTALEPRRVTSALAQLSDGDRELLLLVAWEGLEPAAIAEVVGCSRNAARIRVHRARRRFAAALALADDDVKREERPGHVVAATLGTEERR